VAQKEHSRKINEVRIDGKLLRILVEVSGFEPLTPCLQNGSELNGSDPPPAWLSASEACLMLLSGHFR